MHLKIVTKFLAEALGWLGQHLNLLFPLLNFQQKKESGTIDAADKEILAEAERLDVKAMGPLILSELLFNENIRDQIKKYKRHFLRVSSVMRDKTATSRAVKWSLHRSAQACSSLNGH